MSVLKLLKEIKQIQPQLRYCQILANAIPDYKAGCYLSDGGTPEMSDKAKDIFYIEDEQLVEYLEALLVE